MRLLIERGTHTHTHTQEGTADRQTDRKTDRRRQRERDRQTDGGGAGEWGGGRDKRWQLENRQKWGDKEEACSVLL